jgi:hypothetical protein
MLYRFLHAKSNMLNFKASLLTLNKLKKLLLLKISGLLYQLASVLFPSLRLAPPQCRNNGWKEIIKHKNENALNVSS